MLLRVGSWFARSASEYSQLTDVIFNNDNSSSNNNNNNNDNSSNIYNDDRNRRSMSSEDNNITIVHGVFGSGKSYLLSIICVLIKVKIYIY